MVVGPDDKGRFVTIWNIDMVTGIAYGQRDDGVSVAIDSATGKYVSTGAEPHVAPLELAAS